MNDYVIYTDSACDLSPALLKKWEVGCSSMTFRFDGDNREYSNGEMELDAFYNRMKQGDVARTAAINAETFLVEFEDILQQGKDVLYIGFSSGLSSTYNAARLAAVSLAGRYPDRRIITVDSLSGSAGQGLLVYLVRGEKLKGATLDEAAAFACNMRFKICHWITVDDLVYLKRGGRISPTVAFVGNLLGLKPILCVDNDGKLISHTKVRGRKKAIDFFVEQYGNGAVNVSDGTVYISHAAAREEAEQLAQRLRERYNASVQIIADIGPVLGAHAGPGALAVFYVGKER